MKRKAAQLIVDKLRQLVRDTGLSQNAVAEFSGVLQPIISRLMREKDYAISVRSAEILMAFFGVEITDPPPSAPCFKAPGIQAALNDPRRQAGATGMAAHLAK